MKRTIWLFIGNKIHALVVMDIWNLKIWNGPLIKTSQNEENYINSHSKIVIEIQYIM
jgi:hypothetical protein